jgi:hypothetical protein
VSVDDTIIIDEAHDRGLNTLPGLRHYLPALLDRTKEGHDTRCALRG